MIELNSHTLQNGLRIVHHFDPETKIVAVNVLYEVGGRNDLPTQTGYAHLLEHLMFEGSKNAPDFDEVLQSVGGENNAYTTSNITNYYDILPSQNVETAFWLESDRMANLNLTEESLAVQRNVVAEEFTVNTAAGSSEFSAMLPIRTGALHQPSETEVIFQGFDEMTGIYDFMNCSATAFPEFFRGGLAKDKMLYETVLNWDGSWDFSPLLPISQVAHIGWYKQITSST